jgi:hypothetical protein
MVGIIGTAAAGIATGGVAIAPVLGSIISSGEIIAGSILTLGNAAASGVTLTAVASGAAGGAATAAAAGTGVAAGATSGALFSAVSGAVTGIATLSNPIGWCIVGCSDLKWDCWKPILHDRSDELNGYDLNKLLLHDNVKSSFFTHYNNKVDWSLNIANKWDEEFIIKPVFEVNGLVAAHTFFK